MYKYLKAFVGIFTFIFGIYSMTEVIYAADIPTNEEKQENEQVMNKPSSGLYDYDQLWMDIEQMSNLYYEYVRYGVAGTTACGREIPYIILGDVFAPTKVLVTSTIHACEYVNTEVVMKIVEEYAKDYASGERQEILQKTCFYVLPNCNPDGVDLVQFGIESASSNSDCYDFLKGQNRNSFSTWKANANGVDLNRNWDAGWETQQNQKLVPCSDHFKGYSPNSENEVKAILYVMSLENWDAVINFHQKGNVVFCGSGLGSDDYNERCRQLSKVCAKSNGYTAYAPGNSNMGANSYGSYGDYLAIKDIPYVTIETGTALRSRSQVKSIFNSNKTVFAAISEAL